MNEYLHCGVCNARFDTEAEIRAHTATVNEDGDSHDGEPWVCRDDEIAIIARKSSKDKWCFFGSWRFAKDTDFSADEAIGWELRQLFRMGFVDARVRSAKDARYLYEHPGVEDTQ